MCNPPQLSETHYIIEKFLKPLIEAAITENKPEIFQRLLQNKMLRNGKNIDVEDNGQWIRKIIDYDRPDFVKHLFDCGYDRQKLVATTNDGFNAIHHAAFH